MPVLTHIGCQATRPSLPMLGQRTRRHSVQPVRTRGEGCRKSRTGAGDFSARFAGPAEHWNDFACITFVWLGTDGALAQQKGTTWLPCCPVRSHSPPCTGFRCVAGSCAGIEPNRALILSGNRRPVDLGSAWT